MKSDSLSLISQQWERLNDQAEIGWGEANITPEKPIRLTGKNREPYAKVLDSVYVKSFLISSGDQKIALILFDLWFIHPSLANEIKQAIKVGELDIDHVFFIATHTHSGPGGWASGLMGNLIIGGNSEETMNFLVGRTIKSLELAKISFNKGNMAYHEATTKGMVRNRLNKSDGLIDEKLRWLEFTHQGEYKSLLVTYPSHPVLVETAGNQLSGDYPHYLTDKLQSDSSINLAAFGAGAMGSMSPIRNNSIPWDKMLRGYSDQLFDYIMSENSTDSLNEIRKVKFLEWPVKFRSPQFRLSNSLRIRPWVFHSLMGEYESSLTVLRLNQTVIVGLPMELSGEYYAELETVYNKKGLNLIITSFNGNYLGYANPESYYQTMVHPETREMNWYGPQNGEYLSELIKRISEFI